MTLNVNIVYGAKLLNNKNRLPGELLVFKKLYKTTKKCFSFYIC